MNQDREGGTIYIGIPEPCAGKQCLTKMEIEISKDHLEAKLILDRSDFELENWSQKIADEISKNELSAKIEVGTLKKEFANPDVSQKIFVLCKGTPAVKGTQDSLKLKGRALSEAGKIEDLKKISKTGSPHYLEISKKYPEIRFVNSGEIIAEYVKGKAPQSGRDIWGKSIDPPSLTGKPPQLDKTILETNPDSNILAKVDGVLCYIDENLFILPVNLGPLLSLEISPDKMSAKLLLGSSYNFEWPERPEIMNFINQKKIAHGLLEENLNKFIKESPEIKTREQSIDIAKGTAPVPGKDGRVLMLISLTPNLKPKKNEDGSVSFKDVNVIKIVEKGQELARILPPEKGLYGHDVLGNEIAAPNGKAAAAPLGSHVSIHPQKPDTVISDLEGIAKIEGGKIHVNEGCVIKGNVDFHSGNIHYAKDVIVMGDVMPEFRIDCGGNLQVDGAVEAGFIKASGKVVVKSGFIGHERSWIRAGGDVEVKYIRDQQIFSNGNIHIAGEAIQARLFAGKAIYCHSKRNSFTGGGSVAFDFMEAQEIGNPSEQKTFIVLGWQPKAYIVFKHLNAKIQKAGESKNQRRLEQLERVLRKLEKKYPCNLNAYLRIHQKLYPGLIIQIGYEKRVIQEEISHCLIKLDAGRIAIKQ